MLRLLALAFFGLAACGRVSFDERVDARLVVDPDAAIDAAVDAAIAVFVIETPVHHFGDTVGGTPNAPEPNNWSKAFGVDFACSSATYELDWHPPWGPNAAAPPSIKLNNIDLGSVLATLDPQLCGGGDCNPLVVTHATFDATSAVVVGANNLQIIGGAAGDDYFIGGQVLRCTQ